MAGTQSLPKSTSEDVAVLSVPTSGEYAVTGMVTAAAFTQGDVVCHEKVASFPGRKTTSTLPGYNTATDNYETVATNGILKAGSLSPIVEVCQAYGSKNTGGDAFNAQLTAVQLASGGVEAAIKPANKFLLRKRAKLAAPTPRHIRSAEKK